MRSFILNLGDWAEATSELTFTQQGAYLHLLRYYYREESPIPLGYANKKSTKKNKSCAKNLEEVQALQFCLQKFFYETEDGWHHSRVDKEIKKYQESTPARMQRQAVKMERSQRFNAERYALFKVLRDNGMSGIDKRTPVHVLRDYARRTGVLEEAERLRDERLGLVRQKDWVNQHLPINGNAAVNVDLPATQAQIITPLVPPYHLKKKKEKGFTAEQDPAAAVAGSEPLVQTAAPSAQSPNTALKKLGDRAPSRVAEYARSLGIKHANPNDEALLALLASGIPVDDLLTAAQESALSGKGWAGLLTIARDRHAASHQNGHQGVNGNGSMATQPDTLLAPPSASGMAEVPRTPDEVRTLLSGLRASILVKPH